MHSIAFLQDLAVVMILAGLVTVLFHRFKQPVVLGYILAGFLIGPHTPPFALITSQESINTLADIGVILLMFSLGLEFSLGKLKQVGGAAAIAALLEIFAMGWVGYELGRVLGWSTTDSLFLGAMLSMSSTTVIIKVLGDMGLMKESFAQLVFGILIIEDILGIAMIALLSGIATTGGLGLGAVGGMLGKLGIFLVVVLVAGLIAVPRFVGYVARFKSNEMLLITVLGLCFGVSLLAARLGYSVALGAFIIGAIIAEAREIHRIEKLIEPVRDMFSAVFFVAIGLLIDPRMLVEHWGPILAITLAVVVCKVLACSSGAFLGGYDGRTSLRVGMSVAQIGEFSFIIASLGVKLDVTSPFLYPVAVAVSAITTWLTPWLIRSADDVGRGIQRVVPRPLARSASLYTQWAGRLGGSAQSSLATKLTRRWLAQMGVNVALMAGVFVAAVYVGEHPPAWLARLELGEENLKSLLWLAAVILSLPLFIATSRKLQAWGLLIAETRVTQAAAGEHAPAIRAVVAQVVPIAGTVALGFYTLVLTSALLTTFKVLIVMLGIVGIVAWLLRRSFIKIYAKGQIALQETFTRLPPAEAPAPGALPSLLREADLKAVGVGASSPAAGKLIRELALRSRTGASIVGLERGGTKLINPGPDEELHAGDQVLLLGTPAQLVAAVAEFEPANGPKQSSG